MTFYRYHQLKKAVENSGSISSLGTIFNMLSRLCKTSYVGLKKTEQLTVKINYLPINVVRTTLDKQISRTNYSFQGLRFIS